jgi:hypothetical protein
MKNLKEMSKEIFEKINLLPVWEKADKSCFKRVGNDLYFYDPMGETGITLGNHGNGWVCIYEDYFI